MTDSVKFYTFGIALLLSGLILGFTPITVGDVDWPGDGFECGSAFVSSDKLTDFGHETCLINGGGATRRITAFALLGAGLVFLAAPFLAAPLISQSSQPGTNE